MENNDKNNTPGSINEPEDTTLNGIPPRDVSGTLEGTPVEPVDGNGNPENITPAQPSAYPAPQHAEIYGQGSYAAPAGYHQAVPQADAFGNYPQQPQRAGYGGYDSEWNGRAPNYVRPRRGAHRGAGKTTPLVVAVALIAALAGGGISGSIVAANYHNSGGTNVSSSASQAISTSNEKTVSSLSVVVTQGLKSVVTVSSVGANVAGTGSGVVLNAAEGYIVTNAHVATLEGATANAVLTVQTSTGNTYNAKLVGYDATADLAVLKVSQPMKGVEDIKFASSDNLAVGTGTIAIGAPLGLSGTVTTGIVSALNRPITVSSSAVTNNPSSNSTDPFGGLGGGSGSSNGESTQTSAGVALNVIQTDASINPGNSGGALLDDNGNLIGINVAIASASASSSTAQSGSVGVGFAIPSSYVKRITTEIISNGKGTHGYLGVGLADYTTTDSTFTSGAKLTNVTSGSAADKAGLQQGDIITGIDGKNVESALQLASIVKEDAPGAAVTVSYTRNGSEKTADIKLAASNS